MLVIHCMFPTRHFLTSTGSAAHAAAHVDCNTQLQTCSLLRTLHLESGCGSGVLACAAARTAPACPALADDVAASMKLNPQGAVLWSRRCAKNQQHVGCKGAEEQAHASPVTQPSIASALLVPQCLPV